MERKENKKQERTEENLSKVNTEIHSLRRSRWDKELSLKNPQKEHEDNNQMGRVADLLKKITNIWI